eukprot:365123-Chlamydomonas_euryale.AAC.17
MKLVAVPLFEIYDNPGRYGPLISAIPAMLSRCDSSTTKVSLHWRRCRCVSGTCGTACALSWHDTHEGMARLCQQGAHCRMRHVYDARQNWPCSLLSLRQHQACHLMHCAGSASTQFRRYQLSLPTTIRNIAGTAKHREHALCGIAWLGRGKGHTLAVCTNGIMPI